MDQPQQTDHPRQQVCLVGRAEAAAAERPSDDGPQENAVYQMNRQIDDVVTEDSFAIQVIIDRQSQRNDATRTAPVLHIPQRRMKRCYLGIVIDPSKIVEM